MAYIYHQNHIPPPILSLRLFIIGFGFGLSNNNGLSMQKNYFTITSFVLFRSMWNTVSIYNLAQSKICITCQQSIGAGLIWLLVSPARSIISISLLSLIHLVFTFNFHEKTHTNLYRNMKTNIVLKQDYFTLFISCRIYFMG